MTIRESDVSWSSDLLVTSQSKKGCEEMKIHFFTALFLLSFGSGFRVQGSRFRVQGSGFKVQVAASPPFLEDGILVSQPSPLGNAIKLSGRTFLAPHRGSCPKG